MKHLLLICTFLCWAQAEVLVLNFHQLGAQHAVSLALTPTLLGEYLVILQQQGYTFTTLSPQIATPSRQVAISFDDGYESVYQLAFPVLEAHNAPASVFIITEKIGEAGYLSVEQLRELQEAGWQLGSHSASHADLRYLTPSSISQEMLNSRVELEAQFALSSSCIAYPFGRHDARVRSQAAAHYDCAFATSYGLNSGEADPYALHRPLHMPLGLTGFTLQLEHGYDLRVVILPALLAYWFYPSQTSELGVAPRFYHPARFVMMGSGALAWHYTDGKLQQSFFDRSGQLALSGTVSKLGAAYVELSAVVSFDTLVIGLGASSSGVVLASAVPLGGYGEIWFSAGHAYTAAGLTLIPRDYLLIQTELHSQRGFATELRYALPLWLEEGRPLRGVLGVRGYHLYGGAVLALGSTSVELGIATDYSLTAAISFQW